MGRIARMAIAAVALAATAAAAAAPAPAAPVSVGGSGWLWGDPVPQGETLNRVAFQGARGFAAGEGGAVLRSDDGGGTWVGLPSGTRSNLTLLQQVDANTVVVGGGCTVRESTDGGASFHRLPVNEAEEGCATKVAALSFLSPATGYVEQADGSVLLTKDAGQTLEPKTSVPLNGAGAGQIVFVSPTVGFALVSSGSGGKIYRTTDGAGSWTQVGSSPNALNDIRFVSATVAYAVGANGVLLRSTDAGATWSPLPLALPPGTARPTLAQITCSDVEHCLIATAPVPSPGVNMLVRTSDGGGIGSLVSPSAQNLLSVAFSTASKAVAVGEHGATVLSSDGGVTFPTTISTRFGVSLGGPIRLGASAQDAYLAGGEAGVLAATTDGGNTWNLLRVPTSAGIIDVGFPTTNVGYAVARTGTVFRTGNGGVSWSILNSGGGAPNALLAPNESTAVLVGPTGLRRTTNAGASFASVSGSVVLGRKHGRVQRRRLSAFPLFAGAQTVGSAMIVWGDEAIESTDGGAHWALIPRPLRNGNIEGLSFVTPSSGYAVSRQRLFFTRNRGRSWKEVSSLGTEAPSREGRIAFSSVSNGYAISTHDESVVLHTVDGGRTWIPESLPHSVVALAAGGTFDYAIGQPGLFTTTTGGLNETRSKLALSIVGPRRLSRAKLLRGRGRVKLKGVLTPAQGGETVTISYQAPGRSGWQHRSATVASNGAFSLAVSGLASSTHFVAQWEGEGAVAGAGTPVVSLTVTKH